MKQVYGFAVGERVRWEYPLVVTEFGVVVKTYGPPTGIFGNYGVLVRWDNRPEPEWHDDLDLIPAPVVDLLASIPTRTRHRR